MSPVARRRRLLQALAAAPWIAHAQTRALRTIGMITDAPGRPARTAARLAELGHVEGIHIRFELRRVAAGASEAAAARAAEELVRAAPDVLLASGVTHVLALARATSRIPIVCAGVSNPVGIGVARSLRAPGGNVTGLSHGLPEAAVLQLGGLRIVRPGLRRVLFVLGEEDAGTVAPEHAAAASALGVETPVARVTGLGSLEASLKGLGDGGAGAAWIAPLPPAMPRAQVAALAVRLRVPTHGMGVHDVRAGMLMSCWLAHSDAPARIASTIDKILRGAHPSEIPFELPDRTDIALNRATAAAIGVRFTDELLLRAREVVG